MSDKKNIDRIFKEKFKDFEAAPPAGLWDAIENNLEQPAQRPKKILPLWLKLAGIAAGVALLLGTYYTLNTYQFSKTSIEQQVVDSKDVDSNESQNSTTNSVNKKTESNIVSDTDHTPTNEQIKTNDSELASTSNQSGKSTDNELKKSSEGEKLNTSNTSGIVNRGAKILKTNSSILNQNSVKDPLGELPTLKQTTSQKDQAVATTNNSKDMSSSKLRSNDLNKTMTTPQNKPLENNSEVTASNKTSNTGLDADVNKANPNTQIVDPVKKQPSTSDVAQVDVDSTKTQQPTLDALAQQQNEQQEKIKDPEDTFQKAWTATSMIAPVFSNTSAGSSIGEDFVDNGKVGGVNLSYGVAVGYEVSPRLSVRTGVHRVDMSYTTNDVVYKQPFDPGVQLVSISNFNPTAVSDAGSTTASDIGSSFSQEFLADNTFSGFQGGITQRLGYLEVPLELRYKVIDSKFSLNVIGGMSALFLTDNNIAITDNNTRLDLGADNNFNDFNQSANFGLGIDYSFTSQLGFSIEPVFKYQLSPLRNNIAGFRPYNIGVYSGITYRF